MRRVTACKQQIEHTGERADSDIPAAAAAAAADLDESRVCVPAVDHGPLDLVALPRDLRHNQKHTTHVRLPSERDTCEEQTGCTPLRVPTGASNWSPWWYTSTADTALGKHGEKESAAAGEVKIAMTRRMEAAPAKRRLRARRRRAVEGEERIGTHEGHGNECPKRASCKCELVRRTAISATAVSV